MALQKKRFKELDTILASDAESRNLLRAKSLVKKLKSTVNDDHPRQKELVITEQWINELLDYRANIKLLEEQTQMLRSEVSRHKQALEQVRRTLVTE